jgi:hypothetical protein
VNIRIAFTDPIIVGRFRFHSASIARQLVNHPAAFSRASA